MSHFSLPIALTFQPIRFAPILLTATVVFGIFLHDTTVDHAALVALPIAAATYGVVVGVGEQQHTHVEEVSLGQTLHQFSSAQPHYAKRNDSDDEKRHKKSLMLDDNSEYHWPSIEN